MTEAPARAETPATAAQRPTVDTSTQQRKWTADKLVGLAHLIFPTFKSDFETLDEEGIRNDVRNGIAQGFSGVMPMINWTVPSDPRWEEYYRIVIDEAKGKQSVHGIVVSGADADIALIQRLEALGVEMILLASRHPADISAADLGDQMERRIRSTELPIMLYAALSTGRRFMHLGPSGQPLDVFDRLADLPNVTAMKVSHPVSLTSTQQLCETVGDRVFMGPVNLDFVPLLARHHHIQWSGQWNAEGVQTAEDQVGNALLAACAAGDFAQADKLATRMQPVIEQFYEVQAAAIAAGVHPYQHNRYYAWLSGGNGGLVPAPPGAEHAVPVLTAKDRAAMRAAFAASGLKVTDDPEELFLVGRAAWDRGVRPSDLPATPFYEA
ncbi:MAG: hypothetical protein R3C52_10565 [Hyphomonadaceae bacterium]